MSSGHIRQRGKKSWELKFDAGRDENGKRIIRYVSFKGTKREANAELERLIGKVREGTYVDAGKLTLGEYLKDWLAGRHDISPKTRERYVELVELHIVPEIGGVPLKKLTGARLNTFYGDRKARGNLRTGAGLSPQTIKHMDRLLHAALEDARKQRADGTRLIAFNPVDDANCPTVERKPPRTLSADELPKLLNAANGGPLYAPVYTILGTGLRRGELLALRWRNVDLDGASVQVVESIEETKAGLRVKGPKTRTSRRRVDLPASVVTVLREHRVEQQKRYLKLGKGWSQDDLVFGNPLGEIQRPRNFTKSICRLAARAGLKGVSPHVGRHDHLSRLFAQGTHPKVAQLRAGHSSIAVTMDVYSHAGADLQREAVELFDNTFPKIQG